MPLVAILTLHLLCSLFLFSWRYHHSTNQNAEITLRVTQSLFFPPSGHKKVILWRETKAASATVNYNGLPLIKNQCKRLETEMLPGKATKPRKVDGGYFGANTRGFQRRFVRNS